MFILTLKPRRLDVWTEFDTFAFRRPDLLERLQVFEIDHPATQALKHERLAVLGRAYPAQLHFVAIDFLAQRLPDVLPQSAYDPRKKSFFSWLGVTYYLTREAVFDTLRDVAAIASPGSVIVFDYMDTDAFNLGRAARRIQLMQAIARQVGEPMQAGFDPMTLAEDLSRAGLRLEENLGPVEIEDRYFRQRADEYHAFEHVHLARAVCARRSRAPF